MHTNTFKIWTPSKASKKVGVQPEALEMDWSSSFIVGIDEIP